MNRRSAWIRLLVNAGFAAAITAVLGLLGGVFVQGRSSADKRCELAAAYLQDETPAA